MEWNTPELQHHVPWKPVKKFGNQDWNFHLNKLEIARTHSVIDDSRSSFTCISHRKLQLQLTRYGGYKRRSMDDETVAPHSFTWIRRERSLTENSLFRDWFWCFNVLLPVTQWCPETWLQRYSDEQMTDSLHIFNLTPVMSSCLSRPLCRTGSYARTPWLCTQGISKLWQRMPSLDWLEATLLVSWLNKLFVKASFPITAVTLNMVERLRYCARIVWRCKIWFQAARRLPPEELHHLQRGRQILAAACWRDCCATRPLTYHPAAWQEYNPNDCW